MLLLNLKTVGYVYEEKFADIFNCASITLKVVFDSMTPRHLASQGIS